MTPILFRTSLEALALFATRDDRGNRLSVDLGQPVETATMSCDGAVLPVHNPTITVHSDDNNAEDATLAERARILREVGAGVPVLDAILDVQRWA